MPIRSIAALINFYGSLELRTPTRPSWEVQLQVGEVEALNLFSQQSWTATACHIFMTFEEAKLEATSES